MLHLVLFIIFGTLCVGGAINLLLQTHPINSALSLIVVMGSLALIYLLMGAEFVSIVQLIIYAGAIMVLFVFTIMLLNAGKEERLPASKVMPIFGLLGMVSGSAAGIYVLTRDPNTSTRISLGQLPGPADKVGLLLFKDFLLPFEVTSVLILIAIMGAVVLARRGEQ
ncbi:MAG TPA: NADH-quinone oxidoreductase subunit J [Candidatus Acidoferrales bacterium]|jgi:NADH-quinone oxidoreductase subunit J|nr:NADH-quinone oxidoreductase subunit J [Candidatus Acidoferrales bacterium]